LHPNSEAVIEHGLPPLERNGYRVLRLDSPSPFPYPLGRSYLGSCRPKAPGSASCRNLTPKLRIQRNAALPTSSVGSRKIIPFGGAGGGKWQIPNAGGSQPVWRRDGRKIFYLSLDSTLTSVPVRLKGGTDEVGAVHPLFRVNHIRGSTSLSVGPWKPAPDMAFQAF